jgi:ribose transport system substrate-binding protein
MHVPRSIRVVAVLAVTATLAACGSDGSEDGDATNASAGAGAGRTEQATYRQRLDCDATLTAQQVLDYRVPKADRRYRVTLMEVSLAGYYYQAIAYGASKAAREAGVELDVVAGQGYISPGQQIEQMQNVIARRPDAILFAASDPKGSVPAVQAAERAGIPVINMSAQVESELPSAFVLQDEYEMGQRGADQLAKAVPEGGRGIVMAGPANALWSRRRAAGFADRLRERYPDHEIVETTNQLVDPAEGAKDFANAIQGNPEIDWIYSTFVFQLPPESIPPSHRDVPYVTTGFEPLVIEGLERGGIDATLGVYNVAFGYLPMGRAVETLNGDTPPRMTCLAPAEFTQADIGTPLARGELYPADFTPPR